MFREDAGKELMPIWKVVDEETVDGRVWVDHDIPSLYQDAVSLAYHPSFSILHFGMSERWSIALEIFSPPS